MQPPFSIVVTTINAPNEALVSLQNGATKLNAPFYVVGDTKSPADFDLPGALWYDVGAQRGSGFRFAEICPTRHYARKNIGYLLAMRDGAEIIVETDDDNLPRDGFWSPRSRLRSAPAIERKGWCNVYRYYSDVTIWPRGLPLDEVLTPVAEPVGPDAALDCPIQQGLADENPDVDAIYRLILPLPQNFKDGDLILREGVWCPFNSQNTTTFRDAFPLLYLPYHCSFRMTDIWRSFVAQRLMWTCGWNLLFHGPTVWQDRNEHSLMRDFADEVPGYLNNDRIRGTLEDLDLDSGVQALSANLFKAYDALIKLEVVGADERGLVDAWRADIEAIR
jgi:hypothetical protein